MELLGVMHIKWQDVARVGDTEAMRESDGQRFAWCSLV